MSQVEERTTSNEKQPVPPSNLILVGIDGSENSTEALREANKLAGDKYKLLVVHAYSVPAYVHRYSFFDELTVMAEDAARKVIDAARKEIGDNCKQTDFEIAPGRPAHLLAEMAKQRQAKMIVVGSRGDGGVRTLLGGQSRRLLSISPCPVMVVPDPAHS